MSQTNRMSILFKHKTGKLRKATAAIRRWEEFGRECLVPRIGDFLKPVAGVC
jgi:hypothetical protein